MFHLILSPAIRSSPEKPPRRSGGPFIAGTRIRAIGPPSIAPHQEQERYPSRQGYPPGQSGAGHGAHHDFTDAEKCRDEKYDPRNDLQKRPNARAVFPETGHIAGDPPPSSPARMNTPVEGA